MIKATLEGRAALLADVGGTNTRFTLLTDGELGAITHMAVKDNPTFQEALAAYLSASAGAERQAQPSGVSGDGRDRRR